MTNTMHGTYVLSAGGEKPKGGPWVVDFFVERGEVTKGVGGGQEPFKILLDLKFLNLVASGR